MANLEHIHLVQQGSEAIAQWRSQYPEGHLDLFGAILTGADLFEANLSGADLIEANLTRANLSGADLIEANLFEANLSGANLSGANLSGANLSGADLSGANLSGADLIEANLSGANLPQADLTKAILTRAILTGADLTGAILTVADLTGADLTGAILLVADLFVANLSRTNFIVANLIGVNLSGANLTEANLSGATCGFTTFAVCNLGQCQGLESVVHEGPSSIGIDTLMRSRGSIPRAFLLGAGVPREVLEVLLPLVSGERRYYRCFISYTSANERLATRLFRDLRTQGVACWKYCEEEVGAELVETALRIYEYFDNAIQDNDKKVTICSQASLEERGRYSVRLVPYWIGHALSQERDLRDENVRREREAKKRGKAPDLLDEDVLVPVRLDGFVLHEWQHERRADVRAKHILDFSEWRTEARYQAALKHLLHALNPATWGPG